MITLFGDWDVARSPKRKAEDVFWHQHSTDLSNCLAYLHCLALFCLFCFVLSWDKTHLLLSMKLFLPLYTIFITSQAGFYKTGLRICRFHNWQYPVSWYGLKKKRLWLISIFFWSKCVSQLKSFCYGTFRGLITLCFKSAALCQFQYKQTFLHFPRSPPSTTHPSRK